MYKVCWTPRKSDSVMFPQSRFMRRRIFFCPKVERLCAFRTDVIHGCTDLSANSLHSPETISNRSRQPLMALTGILRERDKTRVRARRARLLRARRYADSTKSYRFLWLTVLRVLQIPIPLLRTTRRDFWRSKDAAESGDQ